MIRKRSLRITLLCIVSLLTAAESIGQTNYPVNEIYGMRKTVKRSPDGSIELYKYTNTDVNSSWAKAELVIVKINTDCRLELHDFRETSTIENLLNKHIPYSSDRLVIMSGGFFDNANGQKEPIGLVIANRLPISEYYPWEEGGMLIQQPGEDFLIVPVDMYEVMDFGHIDHALQSLPLVVEDGEIAIRSASYQKGHRIGLGYDKAGNVIIACGYAPHSASFSLYDFAHLLTYSSYNGGPDLDSFIALDGGPSIYLEIPSLGIHYGRSRTEEGYIVNLISILKR